MDKALSEKRPSVARQPLGRYRLLVASRAIAAIAGGYVIASAFAASMGFAFQSLGMTRADSVMASTMLAFVVHVTVAIWVFACVTTARVWLGIFLLAVILLLVVWFYGGFQ